MSASANEPARLGVGVVLLLLSDPFVFRLIAESRGCRTPDFLPATGRLAGGWGGVGLLRAAAPFMAGGGGGARGISTGAATISSTYAAGTQASPESLFASHQPRKN
jgi:hypothetical protein